MKKYIYGTLVAAVLAGLAVFFFRPPETANHVSQASQAAQTTLELTFRFPEGYELTEGAPFILSSKIEGVGGVLSPAMPEKNFNPFASPYRMTITPGPDAKAVVLNAQLYYCQKTSRMCFQGSFKARIPLAAPDTRLITYVWKITPENTSGPGARP